MGHAPLAVLLTSFVLLAGCGDQSRDEARLLLSLYDRVDADGSFAERRAQLEALGSLDVGTEEVRGVRDLCVRAHRALLEAEERSADARAGLAAAGGASGSIPAARAEKLRVTLESSNRSLQKARELLPRCEERVLGLRGRFGRRR